MTEVLEKASSKGVKTLQTLTGMRFAAALLVFLIHAMFEAFFAEPGAQNGLTAVFLQGGWSSVGFFFILSGFVLTWSARPTDTTRGFWKRRALKIYPNHLVMLAVFIAVSAWITHDAFDGGHAVLNALLLQSFFPDVEIRTGFNGVAWTLSCELLFYLCFPLLHRLISRIRPERLWAWAAGVLAAIVAVPVAVLLLMPPEEPFPLIGVTLSQLWLTFQFPPTRLLEFAFGMLLARIVMTGRRLPLGLAGAAVFGIAAYVAGSLLPGPFAMAAICALPMGLMIAAGARLDIAHRRTWLATRPMIWLGEVSFAFYMVHFLVLDYVHRLLGGASFSTPVAVAVVVLVFAVTLVLAWGLHSCVERPIMRRFARSRPHAGRST